MVQVGKYSLGQEGAVRSDSEGAFGCSRGQWKSRAGVLGPTARLLLPSFLHSGIAPTLYS